MNALKELENDTSHFAPSVSQALRGKMFEVAEAIKEDFISDCGREAHGCNRIEPIYGKSYDGFIPFQDGGYEISEFYRNDIDSSYHFTKAQSESMERSKKDMYESFYHDHIKGNDKRAADVKLDKDFSYSDLPEKLQSVFSDYENEWFESALLRCELWVSDGYHDDKADTIYYRVSLGYKDAPYYRSKYDETLFEGNVSIKAFMKAKPEAFVAMLKKKMDKVS